MTGAAEGDQALRMAAVAAHTQESMLQAPAAQELVNLPAHVVRQRPALARHLIHECRVVLLDDPVEQRLLGPVALVAARIPLRCKC